MKFYPLLILIVFLILAAGCSTAEAGQKDDIRVVAGLVVAGEMCEIDTRLATFKAIMDAAERNKLSIERVTKLAEKQLMTMTRKALMDPVLLGNMCYDAGQMVEAAAVK